MSTLTDGKPSLYSAICADDNQGAIEPPKVLNILVALDLSVCSKTVLDYAASLAGLYGATLTIVHVVAPFIYPEDLSAGFAIEQLEESWIAEQKEKLEGLRKTIKEGIPETVVVTSGAVWNRIIDMAKKWNAYMIVIGTSASTLKHRLVGSAAEQVVRHAACPVLMVPADHICAEDRAFAE